MSLEVAFPSRYNAHNFSTFLLSFNWPISRFDTCFCQALDEKKAEATKSLDLATSLLMSEQQKYEQQTNALQSLKDEQAALEAKLLQIQEQQGKVTADLEAQTIAVKVAEDKVLSCETQVTDLANTAAIADEDMASIEELRVTVQNHRDSLVDRWNGGA